MKVVVNHLTRMSYPYVCVAGVAQRGSHCRPVLPFGQQLSRRLLKNEGGPVSLGQMLDLGPVQPCSSIPEVEDVEFDPSVLKPIRALTNKQFLKVLTSVVSPSLGDIFGTALRPMSKSRTSAAVPEGKGMASLGVLQLGVGPELWHHVNSWGKPEIRLRFLDQHLGELKLKVTDIRLWEHDQVTPSAKDIKVVGEQLNGCYISVGLTRAHEVSFYDGRQHWLQVNNIFPADKPLWDQG